MYNDDEIHKISSNINRMNLHCRNDNCPARNMKNMGIFYSPFMQVITNDPNPWECVKYGLIFFRGETPILLEGEFGYDYTAAKILNKVNFSNKVPLYSIGYVHPVTYITSSMQETRVWTEIRKIPFVKLDTGDDMHMHARTVMEKLTKLLAFM
jgi:hypothetical protein